MSDKSLRIEKRGEVTCIVLGSDFENLDEQALDTIRAELEPRLAWFQSENKLIEAQRLKERTQYDLEMLQQWSTTGFEVLLYCRTGL